MKVKALLEDSVYQIKADFVRRLKTNEGRGDEIGTYDLWYGDPGSMEIVLAIEESAASGKPMAVKEEAAPFC